MKHGIHQRLGAFGVTAVLGLTGSGSLLRACAPTPPAPAAAAAAATASSLTASSVATEVVRLVNIERAKRGLKPVTINGKLTAAADGHSAYQARIGRLTHTSANRSNAGKRMTAAGYSWSRWGENVAYGYATPAAVMKAWMRSAGHRANILNARFTEIGVSAVASAKGTLYWTMDLAKPK